MAAAREKIYGRRLGLMLMLMGRLMGRLSVDTAQSFDVFD